MTYVMRILFLIIVTFPLSVVAQINRKSLADTSKFESYVSLDSFISKFDQDSFTTYNKKEAIPKAVQKDLDRLTGNFSIANPNQEYACCCTSSKRLPKRKLTYLSRSNDVVAMVYETGGFATSSHILLIQFNVKGIVGLWSGKGFDDVKSIGEIEAFLKMRTKQNPNVSKTLVYL